MIGSAVGCFIVELSLIERTRGLVRRLEARFESIQLFIQQTDSQSYSEQLAFLHYRIYSSHPYKLRSGS